MKAAAESSKLRNLLTEGVDMHAVIAAPIGHMFSGSSRAALYLATAPRSNPQRMLAEGRLF